MDVNVLKHTLLTVSVTMPRMLAMFSVIPFLGKPILQGFVRNSILLSFVFILYPLVAPSVSIEAMSVPVLIMVIGKEIIIGILIGFMVSIIFWAAESVGYFIDNQRGTTMASVMDPMTGQQTSPLGSLLLQTTTVLFFSGGGFLILLGGLFESYRLWPVVSFFPTFNQGFGLIFLEQADRLMAMTVLLASPVIIAVFVSELGLGLINRFAPQLNVFFLSMPIKSAVSSAILILYLSTLMFFFRKEIKGIDTIFYFLNGVIQ